MVACRCMCVQVCVGLTCTFYRQRCAFQPKKTKSNPSKTQQRTAYKLHHTTCRDHKWKIAGRHHWEHDHWWPRRDEDEPACKDAKAIWNGPRFHLQWTITLSGAFQSRSSSFSTIHTVQWTNWLYLGSTTDRAHSHASYGSSWTIIKLNPSFTTTKSSACGSPARSILRLAWRSVRFFGYRGLNCGWFECSNLLSDSKRVQDGCHFNRTRIVLSMLQTLQDIRLGLAIKKKAYSTSTTIATNTTTTTTATSSSSSCSIFIITTTLIRSSRWPHKEGGW